MAGVCLAKPRGGRWKGGGGNTHSLGHQNFSKNFVIFLLLVKAGNVGNMKFMPRSDQHFVVGDIFTCEYVCL